MKKKKKGGVRWTEKDSFDRGSKLERNLRI